MTHPEVAYEKLQGVELPVMKPPPVYVTEPADAAEVDPNLVPDDVEYGDWLREHDYTGSLGSIFQRGFNLYKKQCCTITLTFILISATCCIPVVGWLIGAFMTYGFVLMLMNGMRVNNPAGFMRFNDVFGAFSLFLPVTGLMLVQTLIQLAAAAVVIAAVVLQLQYDTPYWLVCLTVAVLSVPIAYLSVCVCYAAPVLLEFHTRRVGVFASLAHAFRQVNKHVVRVMLLQIVIATFQMSGLWFFLVGVLFTAPLGWVAQMYLFKDMFGLLARDFRAGECVVCV